MESKPKQSERWALFGGLALTVSGVAHLVCPPAVEPVNRLAFKDNIRAHVLINGSIEAALGLALLNSRTRQAALAAALAYLTYFNANQLHTQSILAN